MGWVKIFQFFMGWVGLDWVTQNGPVDNSGQLCSLLALQPHPTQLQVATAGQTTSVEVTSVAVGVHETPVAVDPVPESAARRRTVSRRRPVVVAVERAEPLIAVVSAESIVAGVTREPAHMHRVVAVFLGHYSERAVLGGVPVAGAVLLQVEPQLVAAVERQLTE